MAAGETRSAQLLQNQNNYNPDANSNLTTSLCNDDASIAMINLTTNGFATIDIDPDITEHTNDTIYSATPPPPGSEADPNPICIKSEPAPLQRSRSLSDTFNRSASVLFLATKEHGRKMIGQGDTSDWDGRDRSWTSWVVGLSCGCFLFPTITILALQMWEVTRPWIIFDAVYFVIVTVFSFLNDFVYCYERNPPFNVGLIDQWTATGGCVIAALNIFLNPYPLLLRLLDLVVTLIALSLIIRSRRATEAADWRKWHCSWHLMAGLGLAYIYTQEYLTKNGTFKTIHENLWWPL